MKKVFFDVVVLGGGTAGLMAAIAASRLGARTLVVEASGNLGGNAAVGMGFGGFFDTDGRQVVRGLPQEFVDRGLAIGGGRGHVFMHKEAWISSLASVDPEVFKYVAVQMVREAGCSVWLRSTFLNAVVEEGAISVDVATKSGIIGVEAKAFVDATGDGDLAASVGATFERGGGDRQQQLSTMFRVSNVATDALSLFMNEKINCEGRPEWRLGHSPAGNLSYWCPWKFDPNAINLPNHFGVYWHGNSGDVVINAVGVGADALDIDALSGAEMDLRILSTELFWYLRENVPGFSTSYLSQVYPLGVRESRRIHGDYEITLTDILEGTEFDDVVAMGAYPPDIHDAKSRHVEFGTKGNPAYEIPFRAILPQAVDGVLLAGRCISATFEAQSGLRGIGPSMAVGQAAGVAACLAAGAGINPRDISVSELQKTLISQKAYIGERFEEK